MEKLVLPNSFLNSLIFQGSGGGASGRVTAFCSCGSGSNPGGALHFYLGFFVSDVTNQFTLGISLINEVR